MRITLVSFLSFILCYYCIYISIQISVASAKCLVDQQSLLLQLKNNLTFKPQSSTKLKQWNQSTACCSWSGVTCDKEGHVIGLDLSKESITGGFDNSSSLFSLRHLQKLNLAANNFNSSIPSVFSKLENLTYLNLSDARFVGQIPIEISQLKRLVTLDISIHYYSPGREPKLENPNLQSLVQNLISIRQLYLDGVNITAQGHEWSNALLFLPDLQELSMSNCYLSGPLDSSLSRLANLSIIILDGNNFSSPVPETFANFKNLTTLGLQSCTLTGKFPQKIFHIRKLSVINLSYNANLHGFFPNFPLGGSLLSIIVTGTSFSGELPRSIGNLRHLSELDLSNCQFNGTLPNSLSNLTQLSHLDISFNNFTGLMPSFGMAKKLTHLHLSQNGLSGAIPSSSHFEGLQNLVSIDLNNNSISGSIPSSLFTLPSLQEIQLSFNRFSKIDELSTNVSYSVLNTIDLSNNYLSGTLPTSFFQLSSVSVLDLSNNKFDGSLQLDKLLELISLTTLDLSYNNLSFNSTKFTTYVPSSFPIISSLKLASCNLNTFPGFLRNKSTLTILDLSHNKIQGIVPNWIWKLQNLGSLNISHNFLTNLEGPLQNVTSNLIILDMHNNQLVGSIPVFSKYAAYLDYSMNKFSSVIPQDIGNYLSITYVLSVSNNTIHGSIPKSLCNASNLQVLDLSNNNISGEIPSCLITMTNILHVLNMRKNNIIGSIPDLFPASCALTTLSLQENLLHGQIPKSLVHCSTLKVFDIGTNEIHGGFPCFLNNIPALRVLILRNNNFRGSIGCSQANKPWKMIQIVDIAFNNFSGKIPKLFFTSWDKMMHDDEDHTISHFIYTKDSVYYQDNVIVSNKGQQMELVKILTIFTSIDFSSNHFEGPIPKVLMDFKELHVLNFSNNGLSGEIPSSIGNLKQLESLDLSNNSLAGEIPVQLASLSFLSYLNLSFNHLAGKIPTGTQLQSFQPSSFEGNYGLYGPPLIKKSDDKEKGLHSQPTCRGISCSIDWSFLSMEIGSVFGLEFSLVPSCFGSNGGILLIKYWNCEEAFY
ncbi:receptor-like protein kinase [Trifolium pratense]|uniref:Receptor-like protein kinase n=1 Tax=Trifolium pratense TaxID=57577 RepID=A0A2K3NLY1_TRIPR|nr:receptor-like protein kinase [Trifolium pratense]